MSKPSRVRPSRSQKDFRTGHCCVICAELIVRHELDTPKTYSTRQYCSRACERKGKGTQAGWDALDAADPAGADRIDDVNEWWDARCAGE